LELVFSVSSPNFQTSIYRILFHFRKHLSEHQKLSVVIAKELSECF